MSTPAKHTPGPWDLTKSGGLRITHMIGPRVVDEYEGGSFCIAKKTGADTISGYRPIATLSWDGHDEEEPTANASLIATAPELLAALEAICSEFAQGHPLIIAGRIVIAKALATPVLAKEE